MNAEVIGDGTVQVKIDRETVAGVDRMTLPPWAGLNGKVRQLPEQRRQVIYDLSIRPAHSVEFEFQGNGKFDKFALWLWGEKLKCTSVHTGV